MAGAWRTARDAADLAVLAVLAAAAIVWLVEWRRGDRTFRDERDRLKPLPALALVVGGLIAVGLATSLVAH
jgi:hypothetical protein